MGILCIITPKVAVSRGVLMRLQHALDLFKGRRIDLSPSVQEKNIDWRSLINNLADIPTHIRYLDPPPTHTWEGTTNASVTGMGKV